MQATLGFPAVKSKHVKVAAILHVLSLQAVAQVQLHPSVRIPKQPLGGHMPNDLHVLQVQP